MHRFGRIGAEFKLSFHTEFQTRQFKDCNPIPSFIMWRGRRGGTKGSRGQLLHRARACAGAAAARDRRLSAAARRRGHARGPVDILPPSPVSRRRSLLWDLPLSCLNPPRLAWLKLPPSSLLEVAPRLVCRWQPQQQWCC